MTDEHFEDDASLPGGVASQPAREGDARFRDRTAAGGGSVGLQPCRSARDCAGVGALRVPRLRREGRPHRRASTGLADAEPHPEAPA